jgi:hypothetical protein
MNPSKESLSLNELIFWVKKELLADVFREDDPAPLFFVEEVTVEVNFVVSGGMDGGFDLKVVQLGGNLAEERVQKASIRLKSLITQNQVSEELAAQNPQIKENILNNSIRVLLKGQQDKHNPSDATADRE